MKILFTLATLLFAATVQATPAVGDYSNFNLTLTQGSASTTGSYEISITELRTEGYVMATVVTLAGQTPQRSEDVVAAADMTSDAMIASILGNCAGYGGQLQSLTVPAGTFNSCAMPIDGGTAWIAAVPFGVAKQVQKQKDDTVLTLELKTFTAGK